MKIKNLIYTAVLLVIFNQLIQARYFTLPNSSCAAYREINKIIISGKNIASEFFNLKNGLAGDILQKCINYRMKLAIVGMFDKYNSKSLIAFIIECKSGNQFFFVSDVSRTKAMLTKA